MSPVLRDDPSAAFFDAAARGQLLIKTCPGCARHAHPREHDCPGCGTPLDWHPASGEATLVTWSLGTPGRDEPPVLFGYVELAEGPWLEALLVDIPADRLAEGLPLRVTFHRPPGSEEHIPVFRP